MHAQYTVGMSFFFYIGAYIVTTDYLINNVIYRNEWYNINQYLPDANPIFKFKWLFSTLL